MFDANKFVDMGSEDIERQSLNVFRMKTLGATVVPVNSGSKTLKVRVRFFCAYILCGVCVGVCVFVRGLMCFE